MEAARPGCEPLIMIMMMMMKINDDDDDDDDDNNNDTKAEQKHVKNKGGNCRGFLPAC